MIGLRAAYPRQKFIGTKTKHLPFGAVVHRRQVQSFYLKIDLLRQGGIGSSEIGNAYGPAQGGCHA